MALGLGLLDFLNRLIFGFVDLLRPSLHGLGDFSMARELSTLGEPNGELRWCIGAAAASIDATHRVVRLGGDRRHH